MLTGPASVSVCAAPLQRNTRRVSEHHVSRRLCRAAGPNPHRRTLAGWWPSSVSRLRSGGGSSERHPPYILRTAAHSAGWLAFSGAFTRRRITRGAPPRVRPASQRRWPALAHRKSQQCGRFGHFPELVRMRLMSQRRGAGQRRRSRLHVPAPTDARAECMAGRFCNTGASGELPAT